MIGEVGKVLIFNVIIYYSYLFCLFISSSLKNINEQSKKILLFLFISFILGYYYFSILGMDYRNYQEMFFKLDLNKKYEIFHESIEPFFYYIIYFFRKYNFSSNFFFFFIKGIPLIINFYLINKVLKNKILGLFFLLILNFTDGYCNALRHNIAATFFLLGLYFFDEKKWLNKFLFYCIWIFSTLFHYSMIFLFPFFIIRKKTIFLFKKNFYLYTFIGILFSFFIFQFLEYILPLLNTNIIFLKKLVIYLTEEKIMRSNMPLHRNILYHMLLISSLVTYTFILKTLLKRKELFNNFQLKILNIGILSNVFSSVFFLLNGVITSRINFGFCYGLYLLIPSLKKKERLLILLILSIKEIIIMFYYTYVTI